MKGLIRFIALTSSILLYALASTAQEDPNLEQGLKAYGSYHGGSIDTVSLTNGNLFVQIPLFSYPQRGKLNLDYVILYNNKGWAIEQKHADAARLLLENKAAAGMADGKGVTPLMRAATLGESGVASALLDKGADANARSKGDVTALMFAALTGQAPVVKLLLEHGAQLEVHDDQGRTALFYAAGRGFANITRMLLDKGADPNQLDKLSKTAADYAIEADKMEVAKLLEQHGGKSSAKPNAQAFAPQKLLKR